MRPRAHRQDVCARVLHGPSSVQQAGSQSSTPMAFTGHVSCHKTPGQEYQKWETTSKICECIYRAPAPAWNPVFTRFANKMRSVSQRRAGPPEERNNNPRDQHPINPKSRERHIHPPYHPGHPAPRVTNAAVAKQFASSCILPFASPPEPPIPQCARRSTPPPRVCDQFCSLVDSTPHPNVLVNLVYRSASLNGPEPLKRLHTNAASKRSIY